MNDIVLPWTQSITYECDLSLEEMQLRDAVVKEFLYDRNWVNACKRLGMSAHMALDYAQRFAQDAYVQWKLKEQEEKRALKPQDKKLEDDALARERIIAALNDEAYNTGPGSSHAARVAALKQLCSIYGMDAPKQVKAEVGIQSGVMLVPLIGNTKDWESAAKNAQETLQRETLDGLGPIH